VIACAVEPIERKDGNAIDDGEEPTAARRMPYRRS
jgi:hypothetical protein